MWGMYGNSHSVAHYFVSDEHPRVPLLTSLCGRYTSKRADGSDIQAERRKHCGDCEKALACQQ